MGNFIEVLPINLAIFLSMINQLSKLNLKLSNYCLLTTLVSRDMQVFGLDKFSKLQTGTMLLTQSAPTLHKNCTPVGHHISMTFIIFIINRFFLNYNL